MNTPSEPIDNSLAAFAQRIKRLPGVGANPFSLAGLLILFFWAILNWSLAIRRIIRDYNPLPVWDYWEVANHLERYKAFDFSVFWIQHNEHRILFPESIFATDMLLFGGHQIFSLAVSCGCYFGVWIVLAWALNSDKTLSRDVREMGALFAAIIMGWEGCSVILSNTFLLQWTMLQLAVALSLALLAKSRGSSNHIYFAGAIVSAVVATFSSGNGMLLWPVLLMAAFLMRMGKIRILILVVSAVVSISLFFVGYHSPKDLQFLNIVRHPIYFVGFLASFVSMPLGAIGEPQLGVIFGLCNLVTFSLLLMVAARKKLLACTPSVVLFGSFAFLLASGILTAAGRINPADPAYIAAKAARYVSLPLVNWAVLLLALVWISARMKWELLSVSAIAVLCSLFVIGITSTLRPWVTGNGSFIADQQVATVSVENDVLDPDFEGKLYPDPGFVPKMLAVLRRNHLAIYSGLPQLSWLGRNASSVFQSCDIREPGGVSGVFPVQGGFEITGSTSLGLGASDVVFVNERNIVVGFGEEIEAGVPAVIAPEHAAQGKEWVGFINSAYGSQSFSTYLVTRHGHAMCLVEQSRAIGGVRPITAAGAGPVIAGVTWDGTGWKENTLPPSITEINPITKSFWSSWNAGDQSTGRITSSDIGVPANGCLALSVIHGPSTGGLTVRVIDPRTSQELGLIPLRGGESGWKFWRVPLSSQPPAVRIVAEDSGTHAGEWLAIAPPLECR